MSVVVDLEGHFSLEATILSVDGEPLRFGSPFLVIPGLPMIFQASQDGSHLEPT